MTDVIQLVQSAGEARVDSRVIAERLGVKHKNTIALIEKHTKHFARFGVVPFQTEKPSKGTHGGRPEKFSLLNEDQAYFLLSLTKNTVRVVELKANLVMAFRDARNQAGLDSVMGMILLTAPAPWEKRFGDDYYRSLARVTGTVFDG
ncbi:Rha family transcriptional regulator, partial [Pseudomonas aeruginosa]|nr:Rha family transcriptional regulator [Pseudomonas aeruginosa]